MIFDDFSNNLGAADYDCRLAYAKLVRLTALRQTSKILGMPFDVSFEFTYLLRVASVYQFNISRSQLYIFLLHH